MVDREELLLIVRALLRRPVETLLLTVGVALTVGATVTAVTLAPRVAADSERLLSSLRYREIVVTTTVDHAAMDAPARELLPGVEFTIDDLDRVRSATQAVQYAYAAVETVMRLHGAGGPRPRHETVRGMKVTRDFFPAGKLRAAAGSLFTAEELALGEPIMVIGSELGATLFDDGRTLGRTVAADLRLYRIVGVLQPTGTEVDRQVFIPAGFVRDDHRSTGEGSIKFDKGLDTLQFAVADRSQLDTAYAQVTRYFDAAYGRGVVNVIDQRAQAQAAADRYRRMLKVILFLAAAAVLIAALNLSDTFASRALRRRRSAGILKAIGADRTRVFAVFSLDALLMGAVGSPPGVALASLLAHLTWQEFGYGGLGLGSTLVGVAAAWIVIFSCSVLPAVAAARVPAADAIRYE